MPGQTDSKLFDALFVVLDAFLFVDFLLLFSTMFFIFSRSLLGSMLSSQTDPPTLENVDFTMGILTLLKNQRFRSKDGFENVLGLSWAPFGSS